MFCSGNLIIQNPEARLGVPPLRPSVSVQKVEVIPIQLPQGQNLDERLRLVFSTFRTVNESLT